MNFAQQIHAATLRGERGHGFAVQPKDLPRADFILGGTLRSYNSRVVRILYVIRDLSGFTAQLGQRHVLGDAEQKGFEPFDPPIALHGVSSQKRLLGDVLDVRGTSNEARYESF